MAAFFPFFWLSCSTPASYNENSHNKWERQIESEGRPVSSSGINRPETTGEVTQDALVNDLLLLACVCVCVCVRGSGWTGTIGQEERPRYVFCQSVSVYSRDVDWPKKKEKIFFLFSKLKWIKITRGTSRKTREACCLCITRGGLNKPEKAPYPMASPVSSSACVVV